MKIQKGFTIIELVISIFVLSIAIIGAFNAFSMMVVLTSNTEDRFTAAYLAQEGMEVIRNIRDSNWISTSLLPWDNSFDNCKEQGCQVDYTITGSGTNPVRPWNSGEYLKKDANGFYNYNFGADTKFKRKITIETNTSLLPQHVMKVLVQVSWNEKASIFDAVGHLAGDCSQSNCIEVKETLYDWY